MHNKSSKPSNPWNKNQQQQNPQRKNRNQSQNNHQNNGNNTGGSLQKLPTPSESKFKEARVKMQAAVQKHVREYESSSEEDELESETVIDQILKTYTETGGQDDFLGRTKSFIQDSFLSGAFTCLICISTIKRDASVWSCFECYCVFHLDCIQRWSKDCIFQQKQISQEQIQIRPVTMTWGCPKCRHDYKLEDIPDKYLCFCKKNTNPVFQPFLVPHSCGEICKKDLKPACGHKCLLLCHPGPCPPCPVTVSISCYCGSQAPTMQRCSSKEWSCGNKCGKLLSCGKHSCLDPCHPGECRPCGKKSIQKCLCQSQQKLRDCATPKWTCDKVCLKALDCGHHKCMTVCHEGVCDPCIFTQLRTCPCGKTKHQLPCTEETPTCLDTCDKLLDCGQHKCNLRCHRDACGPCLETVQKFCRCGLHSKEVQCCKLYFCETKCKRLKDCNKHPCNRKCCDENCPPCEKPCGRTLSCGTHKCTSVCHRGPCYPCNQTETVACRCGATKIVVSCGRKHKTKPPKCTKLCLNPPDCHHAKRESHRCHFGDCPPCRQVCDKNRPDCVHSCPALCHSVVLVKIEGQKPSMPWEQTKPQIEKRALPCPDCIVPVTVTCLGGHETVEWPCHKSAPSSCHRPCGRLLDCGNHVCTMTCHLVEHAPNDVQRGSNCEICHNPCTKPRPEGCQHECPKPCHPGPCPPCKQMQRIRCHCGLNQPYISCSDWLDSEKRDSIQSCGNQCPNNFACGHRCRENCHSGPCPNSDLCRKKVKVFCKCKRLKKEFSCELVRQNVAKVDCDEVCAAKKSEDRKLYEIAAEQRRKEEEIKNRKEIERYEKIFEGRKKNKERRVRVEEEERGLLKKYWMGLCSAGAAVVVAFVFFYLM